MADHKDVDGTAGGAVQGEEDLLGGELRSLLSSLPRELMPERDLMEEIAARTRGLPDRDSKTAAGATDTRRRSRSKWWRNPHLQLAAAAVVLIALTSATTTFVIRWQTVRHIDAPTTIADATTIGGATLVGYERIERDYAAAILDLTTALEAERDRLPAETLRLIEDNLRTIDVAIDECLAALRTAPQSVPLQQAVITSYETKLDFLRRAAAITADS
jgi:hypothetical protein